MPHNPASGGSTGKRRRREADMDFATARRAMVDGQVRTSDVTNLALITAMLEVPRERFVPEGMVALAYLDRDLRLDGGTGTGAPATASRWLIKPVVLARLIQAADPGPQDRVLVVGCGTGYSAAVLGRLAGSVVALEADESLAGRARSVLSSLNVRNVTVVTGPLVAGWPASAPYDIVLFDGGVEAVPEAVFSQLAPAGRLLSVVVSGPMGKATYFQAVNGEVSGRPVFDAMAPVLPGLKKTPAFVF
jgi:protein-L-isoaspartate(D-aspartate) O-methyltransferase